MSQTRVRVQHLTAFLSPVTSSGEAIGRAFSASVTTTGKGDTNADGRVVFVEVIFSPPNGQITPAIVWLPVQALADGDEPYWPYPAPDPAVGARVQDMRSDHDGQLGKIVGKTSAPDVVRVLWDGTDHDERESVNVKHLAAAPPSTV